MLKEERPSQSWVTNQVEKPWQALPMLSARPDPVQHLLLTLAPGAILSIGSLFTPFD